MHIYVSEFTLLVGAVHVDTYFISVNQSCCIRQLVCSIVFNVLMFQSVLLLLRSKYRLASFTDLTNYSMESGLDSIA